MKMVAERQGASPIVFPLQSNASVYRQTLRHFEGGESVGGEREPDMLEALSGPRESLSG